MLKTLTFAALCVSAAASTQAQITPPGSSPVSDSIRMRKMSGGYKFYYRGYGPLKMNHVGQLLQSDEAAFKLFKSSRAPRAFGTILGFAGGFLIGYPIGVSIRGGKPDWALAGFGAALAGVSFPLTSIGNRKVTKAVRVYNAGMQVPRTASVYPQLRFHAGRNGVGLALGF